MGKSRIVVVTDKEPVRRLFKSAAAHLGSVVSFASTRSDLRILLGRNDTEAVLAHSSGPNSLGAEHLLWVHKHYPWIQLILMIEKEETSPSQMREVEKVARIVARPKTLAEAQRLIKGLAREESLEETSSISIETADFPADGVDEEIIESITQLIDQLPALPWVVQRILNLIHREESSTKEVAEVISLDPALAARVLRLVNSALFALAEPVTTVHHAVRLLGLAEIRNLALGLKIMDSLVPEQGILDRGSFWEHNLACAVAARQIAKRTGIVDPEEAFMGGLLHDIGKLILDGYFQELWWDVLHRAKAERKPPVEMEAKLIGVPHTRVGRMLAEHWRIPELHQMAIEHHHGVPSDLALPEQERVLCGTVQAANLLARWLDLGSGGPGVLSPIPPELAQSLRLDTENLSQILNQTVKEVAEWKNSLGITTSSRLTQSGIHDEEMEDAEPIWAIEPPSRRLPTLSALLGTIWPNLLVSSLGDPIWEMASKVHPQAVFVDLRWLRVERERLSKFLLALQSKTSAPICVFLSEGMDLMLQESPNFLVYRGPAHRGNLERVLIRILGGEDHAQALN
jgi:putative nucleotidyltransferase with HDIG domain